MSTKVSTDLIDLSGNTGGLVWAKGPTTDQPASATAGEMRVDTTTNTTVVYTGTQWKTLKETAFVVPPVPTHFLVVAGGGAGGRSANNTGSGAGGAGGLRTSYGSTSGGNSSAESNIEISLNTPYNITVGNGGAGTTTATNGNQGTSSTFSTITSIGGGGGFIQRSGSASTVNGGSGGGGEGFTTSAGGSGNPGNGFGTGTADQGKDGGVGSNSASAYGGGGGGGAITVGGSGSSTSGGSGGTGLESSITGTATFFAGGGGGGSSTATGGTGGSGIGGNGGSSVTGSGAGDNGVFNTGSGGGGGGNMVGGAGGSGGSGVVILRYPTADLPYFTTTGTLNTPSATDTVADAAYPVTNTAYYKLDSNANDSALSGYIGQGGIFNGSSSSISGLNGVIPSTNTDCTFSCWFSMDSGFNSSYKSILGGQGTDSLRVLMYYVSAGNYRIEAARGKGGVFYYSSSWSVTPLSTQNWYNLVCVYNNSTNTMDIYLNNILLDSEVLNLTATAAINTNLVLGSYRSNVPTAFWDGKLDQVRIFPTALSSSNVSLLYAETSATSSTLNYPVTATALYEFSGNANDTGGTYNGTATNVLYAYNGTATNVTYGNGRFNEAAVFNGSNSDIDLPSGVNSTTMSVSFWMYIDSIVSGNKVVIEFANGYGVWFISAASGKLAAQSSNGNAAHTLSNSQLSAGSWHHIAAVWDGATAGGRTFYIDNQVQTGGNVNSYLTCDQNTIGSRRTGEFFDGKIDQVRIFSSALAPGDVEDLYNEHFQTKFTDGSDTALKFIGGTGDITFFDTDPNVAVDYLVVAGGGGGGGQQNSGGGGAGGYRNSYNNESSGGGQTSESSLSLLISTNYTLTVGAGGAGASPYNIGSNGFDSLFATVTSTGGGGGGGVGVNGQAGGSGGGAAYNGSSPGAAVTTPIVQGYDGGTGVNSGANYGSGGGGGAGGLGQNGTSSAVGNGGAGLASSITGLSVIRASGGSGGGNSITPTATPGGGSINTSDATPNTGGGGGGASNLPAPYTTSGKSGGSGVVILRYPNTKTITVGAGLTATTAAVGTDSVTTFTAGTGTISFS